MMIAGKQLFGLDLGLSQIWEGEEALLNIPRLKKATRAQGDSAQLLALPSRASPLPPLSNWPCRAATKEKGYGADWAWCVCLSG